MDNDNILEFNEVSVEARSSHMVGLKNISMCLGPGDLVLVMPEVENERLPLCDLAEGLADPDAGAVKFMNEDWREMSALQLGIMRGRIGRVFDFTAWVSNLSIAENIALSERHHTARPDAEIQTEMEQLCLRVGLPSVPQERPDAAAVAVLRRCQWVRAFMGEHRLFLLERPEVAAPRECLPALDQLVAKAVSTGNAVLWTTMDQQVWDNKNFKAARRYKICGGLMQQV